VFVVAVYGTNTQEGNNLLVWLECI